MIRLEYVPSVHYSEVTRVMMSEWKKKCKEISLKVEVLMEMYQAMELTCDDLNDMSNYEKHYNVFKKR